MNTTVATVEELRDALAVSRELPEGCRRTIVLSPAEYGLSQPIALDERDSGLTLRGRDGAILYGGCRLAGWRRDGDLLRAPVAPGTEPRMLLVGGLSRERARFPAEGTLENRNRPRGLQWLSSTRGGWNRPPTHEELTRMAVDPDDIPPTMDVANAEITVYHQWDESTVRVAAFDRDAGVIEFLTGTEHPAGAFGHREYIVWNTREGLTRPGQWYFDRTAGQIVYLPLPGETPASIDAWVPLVDRVVDIARGRDVALRDLRIALCNSPAEPVGLRALRAAGAVEARGAERLSLVGLRISHVAGTGIKLTGCRDVTVDHCEVRQTGAGGIFTHECENETITRNRVEGIGRLSFSAVGIHCGWKSMLVHVQDGRPAERGAVHLAHNTVRDVPYCGITCNGGPHRIEYNLLAGCMRVLRDGAAIYCSRADRTILKGNLVRDMGGDAGYGYYLDEGSRHCVLDGNIAVDVAAPVQNHMAEHCLFCRNVFLSGGDCRIRMSRSSRFAWKHNIVAARGRIDFIYRDDTYGCPVLVGNPDLSLDDIFGFSHCIAFSRSGEVCANGVRVPASDALAPTDPLIGIDAAGRIRVSEGSPVPAMGFVLPDGRRAGADAPEPIRDTDAV